MNKPPERHGKAKVLLVDDHPIVRERLGQLVGQQPDMTVCGDCGDAAGCLAALDAHDSKFPRSAMGEEATVLRIEALIRLGDRARAAELGQRFLASRPTSAHASGVRALLGAAEEP